MRHSLPIPPYPLKLRPTHGEPFAKPCVFFGGKPKAPDEN